MCLIYTNVVEEIDEYNKTLFVCNICNFKYEKKELAEKCEDYCNKYHSCSLEITKNAVK